MKKKTTKEPTSQVEDKEPYIVSYPAPSSSNTGPLTIRLHVISLTEEQLRRLVKPYRASIREEIEEFIANAKTGDYALIAEGQYCLVKVSTD